METFGSGVLISQEGIIVTNNHVVDGESSIEIRFPDILTNYSARVIARDVHTDIAILKIKSYDKSVNGGHPIPFTKNIKKIRSGKEVHTIGYPLGNILGENPRLSSGRISSPFGPGDDPRYFQIDNPTQPGNSGGVVFDNSGNIMGIIMASIDTESIYSSTGAIPQNINFAIKISYIQSLLDSTDYNIDYSNGNNDKMKLEDLIESIEPFSCQIFAKQTINSQAPKNAKKTYTDSEGNKYVGEWENDEPNGYGTFTYLNGDEYVGEWKSGERSGQGTSTDLDGNKYVGEWENGERSGQGTFAFSNGDKYVGEWDNGKYNGQGTINYKNGDKYEGDWVNNLRNGQGKYAFSNGDEYVGEWENGERSGQGTSTFSNGDKYEGEWKNGKYNGQGTFTFSNGDKYVGEWENGRFITKK